MFFESDDKMRIGMKPAGSRDLFDRQIRLAEIPFRGHQAVFQEISGKCDAHRFVEYTGKMRRGKPRMFSRFGQGDLLPIMSVDVKNCSLDSLTGNV